MHITITGNLGSGKSTICNILQDRYGFEIYSTGKVQREIAREMNMTTLEMNQLMCSDHKYDTMIDDATARISRENRGKNIIFDSRLAWHFVEQSFKVFLAVSLEVAADRVMNDNRGEEEKYSSLAEAKELLAARAATEDKRYKDMYNLEYFNYSNYNLVIDSTCCTTERIASIIMHEAEKFEKIMKTREVYEAGNQGINTVLISPTRLYSGNRKESYKLNITNFKNNAYAEIDYIDTEIHVKKDGEDYIVLDGQEAVLTALREEIPYVPVIIK